jgi:predicted phage terminase large subunit-like protein
MAKLKLTAEIIQGLVNSCLIHKFDEATESPFFHKEFWEYCCDKHPNVAIAAPRGHAKSTAITFAYTLASILFQESDFVMIVSATEAQSIYFLGDLKKELQDNEDLIALFGQVKFEKDTETDFIGVFPDGNKFRVLAKGAEQKLRGIKWNSKRPNLIVVDDLEEDEAVISKERRDKMKAWFYGALLPCRSGSGKVRYVGTILHMDALLENLMPKEHDRAYTRSTDLKVWSEKKNQAWLAVKYKAHNADMSIILWPDRYPKAFWLQKQEEYKSQALMDVYSREFLNYPIDEGNSFFKKADFIPISTDAMMKLEKDPQKFNFYIAGDLAITETQRSDYTVFAVAAVDSSGMLYIVDIIRDRMNSLDLIETIFALQQKYKPEIFTLEAGAIEKSIGPFLFSEMQKRGIYINLNTMVPTKDKVSRARSINARMKSGSVRFDKNSDWYSEFEQELLRFPRDKHDDQVDALAWIGLTLDKIIDSRSDEEQEEDEYEDELITSGYGSMGRSATTGY